MSLIEQLAKIWNGAKEPILIYREQKIYFDDIVNQAKVDLSELRAGDVVVLIGDFDPLSIQTMLRLIDIGVILVPLTNDTRNQHEYFFTSAHVDVVINNGAVHKLSPQSNTDENGLLQVVRDKGHPGLVLFSTGTTGRPKAILHDFQPFLERYKTPRPTLKTLNFLLFDHIGGINTLLHTLFNGGTVVAPDSRNVRNILDLCDVHGVEVLPTTPTFLRMMLMSGLIPDLWPRSVRIVTYGTERMDQPTLDILCEMLPDVDFRQTFGMSELGILRVKSEARNSLFMKIGGEGIETKVSDDILFIRSSSRMVGYLNAPSPFTDDGWYKTDDIVEVKDDFYKVTGRKNDVINVGGLKFMASEVERVALEFPGVGLVKVTPRSNPVTGQHVELQVQPQHQAVFDLEKFKSYLKERLPKHMTPRRVSVQTVAMGHRFKKS